MLPTHVLKGIQSKQYTDEDGYTYKNKVYSGLDDDEIESLKKLLPNKTLPKEIEDLLRFSAGFEVSPIGEVRFDALNQFGMKDAFPNSIQLASDGAGNFWILDIKPNGEWGEVVFVCHDPPVFIKQSDNLAAFLLAVDEYGKDPNKSIIRKTLDTATLDVWENRIKQKGKSIQASLEDLAINEGIVWAAYGPKTSIIRTNDFQLTWQLEKPKKPSLFARLFK